MFYLSASFLLFTILRTILLWSRAVVWLSLRANEIVFLGPRFLILLWYVHKNRYLIRFIILVFFESWDEMKRKKEKKKKITWKRPEGGNKYRLTYENQILNLAAVFFLRALSVLLSSRNWHWFGPECFTIKYKNKEIIKWEKGEKKMRKFRHLRLNVTHSSNSL